MEGCLILLKITFKFYIMKRIFFLFALIAFVNSANASNSVTHEKQSIELLKTDVKNENCEEWTWFHHVCPPGSHGEGYYHYIVRDCDTKEEIGRGWYGRGCVDDEDGDDDGGVIP